MAVLRPIGKIQPEVQRPLLRAIKPVQAHEQDDGWQPDVLRLSRTHDEREGQLVARAHARVAAALGRATRDAAPAGGGDDSSRRGGARWPDGPAGRAIIPPLSLVGPTLTIRKFRRIPLAPTDLLRNGTITPHAMAFLRACIQGRLNIVVAGGTGAGKTTLLNAMSSYISPRERIVTIEDAAEVQLQQLHVITLETRPSNVEGRGEVSVRDLFRNALRMRPDRIVIGECRGAEAMDMLQAMN